jgi:chromatin remodeling complex protein RSC6
MSKLITETNIEQDIIVPNNLVPNNMVSSNIIAPTIESQFCSLLHELTTAKSQINDIQAKFRLLEKNVAKELKNKTKPEKKKPALKLQQPTGFSKPALISDEMCIFMGRPLGSHVARTELTQFITSYIRDNKLQDMSMRKRIKPNDDLIKLLHLKSMEEEITYFNIQKYLNIHFIKT